MQRELTHLWYGNVERHMRILAEEFGASHSFILSNGAKLHGILVFEHGVTRQLEKLQYVLF